MVISNVPAMTREQIAEMTVDMQKGTAGPWRTGSWLDNVFGRGPNDEWLPVCRIKRDDAPVEASIDVVDARRIARTPTMESTIIAQAAEIDRLNAIILDYRTRRKAAMLLKKEMME